MFTGLIEETGTVTSFKREGGGVRIYIKSGLEVNPGDSVAVDGACLTVEKKEKDGFYCFLSKETIERTRFKYVLKPGLVVNLERPLKLGYRLDGHLVLGHVDTVGIIGGISKKGEQVEMRFRVKDKSYIKYLVEKGSVAVNGISLTCFDIKGDTFKVALIPITLKKTNLGIARVGEYVNIEFDIIGKYVENVLKMR